MINKENINEHYNKIIGGRKAKMQKHFDRAEELRNTEPERLTIKENVHRMQKVIAHNDFVFQEQQVTQTEIKYHLRNIKDMLLLQAE